MEDMLVRGVALRGDVLSCRWLPSPRAWASMVRKANAVTRGGGHIRLVEDGDWLDRAGWKRALWCAIDRRINARGGEGHES